MTSRRTFCSFSATAMALSAMSGNSVASEIPLKFGHRQANMAHEPGPSVFELADRIQGLRGVELQVVWKGQDLGDRQTALSYKKMAHDWGVQIPSIAGIWAPGQTIFQAEVAPRVLERAVRAADLLGASVILVALFDKNCPRIDDFSSYAGPVALLQQVAPMASDAGIVLGLETSLSPADDKKFVEMIGHPAVQIYYDATNKELAFPGQSIPGIDLLAPHLAQVHLKNETRLLSDHARVNWAQAVETLSRLRYQGWYVFETEHSGPEQCVAATEQNIAFVRRFSVSLTRF
jgi:L-ribulose-5-phosphate 3-epimerase